MKRRFCFVVTLLVSLFLAVPALAGYELTADNFPDAEFRKVLAEFDQDGDGWLIYDEFIDVKKIDCNKNTKVTDVTGIEIFENLESLSVWNCSLKKLDVSANKKLTYLDCCETGISSLDVSSNPDLHQLWAYGNSFKTLDLSNCSYLSRAAENGIYNNDKNDGTACSFADDETSSYLVVDKTITIKLADKTIDVAKLSGYTPEKAETPEETPQDDTPAEEDPKKDSSSDDSKKEDSSSDDKEQESGGDTDSSAGQPSGRTFTFLPLKDGDLHLVGTPLTVPYSVTMTAANGQTYCTITLEDPNGETTQLASSDSVSSGSHLSPEFTPETEGTYTITAVVGFYIDFYLGGPGGIRSRGRYPSITDTIHIQAVTTLPEPEESASPEASATPTASDKPADSSQKDGQKADPAKPDSKTDTAKSAQTSASKAVVKKVKALPAVSKLKISDEAKVTAAYKAYKALSKAEKNSLSDTITTKITKAKKQIKKIRKAEAADKNSIKNREKEITTRRSDGDLKKSAYAPLMVKAASTTGSTVTVTWSKMKGAAGYMIYGGLSGKKNKMSLLTVTSKTKLKVKKITNKKLKKGTGYKFLVLAYNTKNGYNQCLAASSIVHAFTTGGAITDVKQVKLSEAKKVLKKGKTWKIKADTVKKSSKKTLKKILGLRFESSDKSVATVSSGGLVKARKTGKATIYVYAQNGVRASLKVTVK